MAERIKNWDALNVNWVGGDPTPAIPYIMEVLGELEGDGRPQVFNSNMYLSREAMDLLEGVVDVFLTDFKYGNNECGEKLSEVSDYFDVVSRSHILAGRKGELLIRHLVLPGHVECCSKPVLKWISENTPDALVNVMNQYHPAYQAYQVEGLDRCLDVNEYRQVKDYAGRLGLMLC